MTKADIVNEIAKTTGLEKAQILSVVEEFTTVVKGSLIAGEPVYLRGFGSFIIKHRAQKAARNITRKTTMTIPSGKESEDECFRRHVRGILDRRQRHGPTMVRMAGQGSRR